MLKIDDDIPFINKPWGYERIIAHTPLYSGKYIFIESGHKVSRQYHQFRDKTIYVLSGPLHLEVGPSEEDGEILSVGMLTGESYHVEPGVVHRLCAPVDVDVEVIEISTSQLEDVVRLEDAYGRLLGIEA